MTARNHDAMSMTTERQVRAFRPTMDAKLELALDLWLSEMSGSSDQTARMAARLAQLDQPRAA